jgi:hypothetical protein
LNTQLKRGISNAMRQSTLMHSASLSQEEINTVKAKFVADIEFVLEEAIMKHVSKKIPHTSFSV